jgi:hypothetical protein
MARIAFPMREVRVRSIGDANTFSACEQELASAAVVRGHGDGAARPRAVYVLYTPVTYWRAFLVTRRAKGIHYQCGGRDMMCLVAIGHVTCEDQSYAGNAVLSASTVLGAARLPIEHDGHIFYTRVPMCCDALLPFHWDTMQALRGITSCCQDPL